MDFVPPYVMAFFVTEFVLVMQFLWKYIDVIIGKGVSLGILLELIFYWSVRTIPESVPVSILIASVMVFGNLAEKYELSSMKSAGISLLRIMGIGIVIAVFTAAFSLLASNYLKPRANYKFLYRYNAIKKQKPALSIEEGIFNTDFKNIVIRVGDKDPNGQDINDILIYDHSVQDKRDINMLLAQHGRMYAGDDYTYFIMELEDGEQYRELKQTHVENRQKPKPLVRTKFDSWTKVFDLSEFDLEAQKINITRKKYDLLNSWQLAQAIDSFNNEIVKNHESNLNNFGGILSYKVEDPKKQNQQEQALPKEIKDAIKSQDAIVKSNTTTKTNKKYRDVLPQKDEALASATSFLDVFEKQNLKRTMTSVKHLSERNNDKISKSDRLGETLEYSKGLYVLRLNQQHSWALICIVFLFIGASLGSIVKKGGYGYPLLIAIIFFMLFIVMNIMGEKLMKAGNMDPIIAAWLPHVIILPIAIVLTIKAMNDSDFGYISSKFEILKYKLFPGLKDDAIN